MKYTIEIQADDELVELIDAENLVTAAETTLQTTEEPTAALTLVITSNEVVQQLNREYRGIDAPTDVLSFANQDLADDAPTQLAVPDELASEVAAYLGDLIIAYPYAKRQAEHFQNTIAAELRLLVVHGTLHLLGMRSPITAPISRAEVAPLAAMTARANSSTSASLKARGR